MTRLIRISVELNQCWYWNCRQKRK